MGRLLDSLNPGRVPTISLLFGAKTFVTVQYWGSHLGAIEKSFVKSGGSMNFTRINSGLFLLALLWTSGVLANGATHKWRFSPTINAPWAMEDDQQPLDTPAAAAGLCPYGQKIHAT